MTKKRTNAYMSAGEKLAGTIFFVVYLVVMPFAAMPLLDLVGTLLGISLTPAAQNMIYYYVLFAATIIIFHGYIARTSRKLVDRLSVACKTLLVGVVALYGLNELVFRLTNLFIKNPTNLNDMSISAQIQNAPNMTLLIVLFLAPFVEEVLFRGLVFGNLKEKSPILAYLLSCALFALMHVWQFAVVGQDMTYFLLMVQYLVPGLILAWVYDRSGTLWTSIGLHMVANALSVWSMLG